ncbi:MAG: hypothetical protein M0T79_13980 [Actinomycetota bacterium]|nr:hypothetical protein [Actinomycetota bacterium]
MDVEDAVGVLAVVGGVLVTVFLVGGLDDDEGVLAHPAKVTAATQAAVSGDKQRIPLRRCPSTPAPPFASPRLTKPSL